MEILLLGAVEVRDGGQVVDCGPPQQRHVLAVLAASAGRPVTAEALIDRVWEEAPTGARRTLHVYVARLRRLFGKSLPRRAGGYVLDVDPECVDAHRFAALLGQPGTVREALALWRGEPLAGLGGQWAERTREAWRRQYVAAVLAWAEVEIADGNPGAVIGPLAELTGDHPLMEPLTAMLMRALYAAGRGAEALDHYAKVRHRLAEELGTDPGVELQQLHQEILRAEPRAVPAVPEMVPAQLPADVYGFAGRTDHLHELDRLLARAADRPNAVVISAVSGTAGVGKTALAVRWGHRVADEFPDGQLYVNLRGFDPGGQVMAPAEAIRGFLDALGVAPERVPQSLDAQAGMYRSLLAGKRMLVLLDNARDAAQVRPLLPGTPTALAIVTSRNHLTGLVAANGAHPLALDVLSIVEARELLVRRLGAERVAAEPEAVGEIIAACARLPLALTIAAARAQVSGAGLGALAAQLRETGARLDALDAGDPLTQVRAVFSWSYQALSPAAARLFRLLGLHPGPDVSLAAAASLAALSTAQTGELLVELARANMVVDRAGRYTFHDLLRAYAADLARDTDSDAERHDAKHRLLDHYSHTAYRASLVLEPARDPRELEPSLPGVSPEPLDDHQRALDWYAAEHAVLVAAIEWAATEGFDAHSYQLALSTTDYLNRGGHWADWEATQRIGVAAAERAGDAKTQVRTRNSLAGAYIRTGRCDDARGQLLRALELCRELGDVDGEALCLHNLARTWELNGDYVEAREHDRRALVLFRQTGHRFGQATVLNGIGWYHALLGEYAEALATCRQAMPLLREIDDRGGQAANWDSLAYAHRHLGDHEQAIDCYRHAVDLLHELGDRYQESIILVSLGETTDAIGDRSATRDAWLRALEILIDLDHPDADAVRAKLDSLT